MLDCRPADRRPPRDLAAFEAPRRACATAGWEYRLAGAPDPVATAHLRWLAGYRHPRYRVPQAAAALRAAFAARVALMGGAEAAGDPVAVLASYLMAAPGFAVTGGELVPAVEPVGLLDSLPREVLAAAREWERHVTEVETGVAPGAGPGAPPKPEYDTQARTLAQRTQAKAAELSRRVTGRASCP